MEPYEHTETMRSPRDHAETYDHTTPRINVPVEFDENGNPTVWRSTEEVCSICGVQAATLEAGGYRCKEHQHWAASPIRADVEQLLRDVLGYLVDMERAAFISSRRTRDLKQRVEAVVGVKP